MSWNKIDCSFEELNLDYTLAGGQSFRWKRNEDHWISVLSQRIFCLKQDEKGNLLYRVHGHTPNLIQKRAKIDCDHQILYDYFQLEVDLSELYDVWSKADPHFKEVSKKFEGIRILRQDPTENMFSFICSSANNISRISSLVEKLCTRYGRLLGSLEGQEFHCFPSVEALAAEGIELELRELGFGYRAKYIAESARTLAASFPTNYLLGLREVPYARAHEQLLAFPGIGPKVADCVCLMSLDKIGAIPVDTHVWQIAKRDYLPHLKSLTPRAYREIGDFMRLRFGEHAGWAHSVLFCSDLKKFKKA